MTTAVAPTLDADRAPRTRGARSVPGVSALGAGSGVGLGVAVLWMSLVVLIPLAAVVGKAFGHGWSGFWDAISQREARTALTLTAALALGVALLNAVMGTVVAWVLARDEFPGKWLLELVIDLPFALPTIVAGLVMLTLYGRNSPVGIHLVGTRIGLFVALMFVTLPFTVRTVQPVLLDLDKEVEEAAASLGASRWQNFRLVIFPSIFPALLTGFALAFARAVGEYGSVIFIAGNMPMKSEIAPLLIVTKLEQFDYAGAAAIAVVMLAASFVMLLVINLLQRWARRHEDRGQ
jgi:sulfate transport system permease protein